MTMVRSLNHPWGISKLNFKRKELKFSSCRKSINTERFFWSHSDITQCKGWDVYGAALPEMSHEKFSQELLTLLKLKTIFRL